MAAVLEQRVEPGALPSVLLAGAMHVLLVLVLVFGVSWQNKAPEVVEVELWEPSPPPPAPPAPQQVQPPPPAPEPPKPAPAPEPKVAKPDIVEKAPEKKAPPKKAEKPVEKPVPKPVPPKADTRPRAAEEAEKVMREQLLREQAALAMNRERDAMKEQLARDAASARNKGLAEYEAKIRTKVRGNITLPEGLAGNPDAIFLVAQLPTGEVLSTKLVKSSGHRGYDEAVERAILKSSPLPRPDRPELFSRELRLTFRPKD